MNTGNNLWINDFVRTLKVNKDDEVIIFQVIPSVQVVVFDETAPPLWLPTITFTVFVERPNFSWIVP